MTMKAYFADAEKKNQITAIVREIKETPEISNELKEKLEAHSKSKLLEIAQI